MDVNFEYKQFTVDMSPDGFGSDAPEGNILAKVATLGIPDYEDDVIMPGSVGRQEIFVSSWNHNCKQLFTNNPPVGRGVIYEDNNSLIADMKFFIDLEDGAKAYQRVKNLNNLCRWSIAYTVKEAEYKELVDDGNYRLLRYMTDLTVDEASPVDNPGGVGTHTIDVKSNGGKRPSIQAQKNMDMALEIHQRRAIMYATLINE